MARAPDLEHWYLDIVAGRSRGVVPSLVRLLLAIASAGYAVGLVLREWTYRAGLVKPVHVAAKVVSVGNLTLGGTGKTPAVIHLARRYRQAGERVVVLFRGHGARRLTGVNVVHDGTKACLTVADAGDEALLTGKLLGDVPVLAGKDRRLTAKAAVEQFGATLILLDDGFQYRRLWVDEHIVLLDATQPFGTGKLFPAGTLRDPKSALHRAKELWITRTDHPAATDLPALETELRRLAPGIPIHRTCHQPSRLRTIAGTELTVASLHGREVTALAGIGNPGAFVATLRGLGATVVREAFFPDHHPFTAAELAEVAAGGEVVVTTEKDAMRVGEWGEAGAELWVLGVELAATPEL